MNRQTADIQTSVIILNWNGKHFLNDCLLSLKAQTVSNFETIVVDNGSTDGSVEYLRQHFPWVRLVELPENVGFAEGNNLGLAVAQGEYIVTLNNDTKVLPHFMEELSGQINHRPEIGMVAAKILNFYQKERIDSLGIYPATSGIGCSIGIGQTDTGCYDLQTDVFGACAGAAMYRRSMIEETGFFDSDFFAYYEDLDLAWRARLSGWKAVTAPGALVYHVHSATAGRMSNFTVYYTHRNKWFVIIKNWPASLILRYLVLIIVYDAAALLLASIKGKIIPALRARLHLLASFPALLRKRKKVMKLRKLNTADVKNLLVPTTSPVNILLRKMGSGV